METVAKNLVQVDIRDEMKTSYLDYSMSVIIGRALPDVRDGLKPVHRRILYAMLREGNLASRRYSKCAGVVGEVLKKYHPHGDSAVYDALVRMAQPWNMRAPLVDRSQCYFPFDFHRALPPPGPQRPGRPDPCGEERSNHEKRRLAVLNGNS